LGFFAVGDDIVRVATHLTGEGTRFPRLAVTRGLVILRLPATRPNTSEDGFGPR
jgi:hypothetical protein